MTNWHAHVAHRLWLNTWKWWGALFGGAPPKSGTEYIQCTCVLFRNIWKKLAWKYAKNTKSHTEFIYNREKIKARRSENWSFLMRSCSIQCLVLHPGNGYMQKSISCYLPL